MQKELDDDRFSLFLHTFCYLHQQSLAVCRNLALLGPFFNYLAKGVNSFRGVGIPSKMKSMYQTLYKDCKTPGTALPTRNINDKHSTMYST